MELFEHAEEDVLLFRSRVDEATRLAAQTMRDSDALKTRKGRRGGRQVEDDEAHAELMGEAKKLKRR
jgi:hypothetical protein